MVVYHRKKHVKEGGLLYGSLSKLARTVLAKTCPNCPFSIIPRPAVNAKEQRPDSPILCHIPITERSASSVILCQLQSVFQVLA